MKFTKELIEYHRNHLEANEDEYVWSAQLANEALDEIERLQAEKKQVCKWVKIHKHFPDHYSFYNCDCGYSFMDSETMADWEWCPVCGKLIKYVEVENE